MNSRKFDELHEARIQFLHSASYAAFKVCPQLSAYYGNLFTGALGGQRAANYVYRTMCPYCGSLLVDGRSVARVSVVRLPKLPAPGTKHGKRGSSRKAKTPGDAAGRRVVKVRLNDSNAAESGRKQTKEDRTEARRNIRNTVEYLCQLCDSRVVFAGSTKTQLQAAGLDGDARKAMLKMADLTLDAAPDSCGSGLSTVKAQKTVSATAFAPLDSIAVKSGLSGKEPLPAADTQQDKRRKRQKSNLLAAVAANKKKSEAKKDAENASFSLSDFLSNL
ncbi:hypothetical protein GGI20_000318 [Coemansia sp. BCRC 34301]|nr:hypothetical protein GGI20_000318 [Coemansia sp. BCRC 34301]